MYMFLRFPQKFGIAEAFRVLAFNGGHNMVVDGWKYSLLKLRDDPAVICGDNKDSRKALVNTSKSVIAEI